MRLLAVVLGSVTVLAQAQQAPFRSTVNVVPVYVTVTNPDGSFVRGLTKDDFTISDEGKPQEIVSFSDSAQAISVAMILDTSGSMAGARSRLLGAAGAFLDELRPDDRAMVGSLVYQGPPFTADKARLRTLLDLLPPDPGSPVWSALDRGLTSLQAESNRRVIVIYSDGKNQNSFQVGHGPRITPPKASAAAVLARAERTDVMIYAIGFEGVPLTKDMIALAARSGGRAAELKQADNLDTALTAVADELHQQYLLGFTPAAFDGQTHLLAVTTKSPELTVRARKSYVAKEK